MTAQAHDIVVFDGKGRALVGAAGIGLFEPATFGVMAVPWVTALWRGYHATYAVREDRLTLQRLAIGVGADGGAEARPSNALFGRELKRSGCGPVVLDDLAEPVSFSGGMLVGLDFIQGQYVPPGYHPAWKWRVVHELLFESGALEAVHDRSSEAAEVRARLSLRPDEPGGGRGADLDAWIRRCFSLNYDHEGA